MKFEERQKREEFWREQIGLWEKSGTTQRAFCKTNSLAYHCFVYWLRKFVTSSSRPVGSLPAKQAGRFVGVARAEPRPATGLTLAMPNGMSLQGITPENVTTACLLMERLS